MGKLGAILAVAFVHAVASVVFWLWMAGVSGFGFKDKAAWSMADHMQAVVVPLIAQTITLPGRLLLPVVTHELGILALLIANSTLWGSALVLGYNLLRPSREQHNPPVNPDARDVPPPAKAAGARAGYRER